MISRETVALLVNKDEPTLSPEQPIRRAVALLVEGRASVAAVLDDSGALQGVLSQKDCFRPALNASYYQEWKGSVADFMSRNVVTLPASADLTDAAEAFLAHSHRVFPVLDGERFIGLLHRSDVLRRLIELG